jgi:phosphocarrier protein
MGNELTPNAFPPANSENAFEADMSTPPLEGVYQCLAEVTIPNEKGLHIRATRKFVMTAERFDADITVRKDGETVPATSILSLLMLAAGKGSTILIETEGPDAEEAMEALVALVESGFDELGDPPDEIT